MSSGTITKDGDIYIQYFKDGEDAVGNLIWINSGGIFHVGETVVNVSGALRNRYTYYRKDGTICEEDYDFKNV